MRALLPLLLLPVGCKVFITDEEYAARLTHELTGELSIPAGLTVPESAEIVVFSLILDPELDLPEVPEPLLATPVSGLIAGSGVGYALLVPPTPPEETLQDATGLGAPGLRAAAFALGAWTDIDGDGVMGPADTYLGMSTRDVVVWFEAPADSAGADSLDELGAQAGYNTARYDLDRRELFDFDPVPSTKLSLDLVANLGLVHQESLSVEVAGQVALADMRADLLNVRSPELADGTLTSVALAQSLTGQVVAFPDAFAAPPAAHLAETFEAGDITVDLSNKGFEAGIYGVVAYRDTDGDGQIDVGDGGLGEIPFGRSVGFDGDGNLALYLRPTSFRAALSLSQVGQPGWSLFDITDGQNSVRDWDEGMFVQMP